MAVLEVTSAEQFEEMLRANEKVAVMFTATWCGPGRLISPAFKQLSEQYKDIMFVSVDADKVAPAAQKHSIRSMPTFIYFKNGEKSGDLLGADKTALEDKVKMWAA
ncbi:MULTISPECIES: thioredoxin domain-containing protein [unclassified Streptomyces]|uniref:thioredoxin domain-containing protein n=1 Tax=unclassified Streptomyces TaxID=2593676 RepID=UPI00340FD6FF